jgi:hypothetical protein
MRALLELSCRARQRPTLRPAAVSLSKRQPADQAALRSPVGTRRRAPTLGRLPRHLHPLAAPHHLDLDRTPIRLRCGARLRRPSRRSRPRNRHLHPGHPSRNRHCPSRAHRRRSSVCTTADSWNPAAALAVDTVRLVRG